MLPNIPLPEAPSEGSIYSTPYGVVTSYEAYGEIYPGRFNGKVVATVPDYNGMDNALNLLIQEMQAAANNERASEEAFFQQYINKIPKGTKLRADFEVLINSGKYSEAFDTLQKGIQDIYDFNKTLSENQAHFTEINEFYLNKTVIHELADQLGKQSYVTNVADFQHIDLNMTGNQLIESILNNMEDKAKLKMNDKEIAKYKTFLLQLKTFIQDIFVSSYGENVLEQQLNTLENNKQIKMQRNKTKGGEKKHANDPLNQLIWNQIWGILNGKSLEVTIDVNGGARTGSITNDLGQDIKADDYILMTAEGGFTFKEQPQSKIDLQKITHKDELEAFLQQGQFQDNFVIIVSGKDQSLADSFNGKFSKDGIKFAEGESKLTQRIIDIQNFGSAAGIMGKGIDDLIFALVNLEHDMVCAGEENNVKQALGAICMNWMFDDVDLLITQVPSVQSNKIYVYNASGWYYTLSDILQKTINNISKHIQQDLVTVSLSIPKGSSYGEAAKSTEPGLERWEKTRSLIMNNTTLGFKLKVKNLFNSFY